MKATLEFNLDEPQERLEHKRAVNATKAYIAIWDISNLVFRPARKHGYDDAELQALIEKNPDAEEIISKLEDRYHRILADNGIDLNDLD